MDKLSRVVAALAGLSLVAAGAWAFADPASFYDRLATFPPYNPHFVHDIGAFQLGIGATLLIALRWRDALFVALVGAGVASLFHFAAHLQDTDLGGNASDPALVGLLTFVLLAGAVARATALQSSEKNEGE